MADYILSEQRACGWRSGTPLKPVLKCCIEANSSLGFCDVCEENFAYRNGSYYPGFRYRSDDELLDRISSGMKPFGSIPRHERDLDLEMEITQRGLYLVRVFRNRWGMFEYHVMKNRDLKLSDVVDLNTVSDLLDVEIFDKKIRCIGEEPCKLMFGYPFYTLTVDGYLS